MKGNSGEEKDVEDIRDETLRAVDPSSSVSFKFYISHYCPIFFHKCIYSKCDYIWLFSFEDIEESTSLANNPKKFQKCQCFIRF